MKHSPDLLLKICIIAGEFPARSETFIRDHALGFARRGHEVVVLSSGPGKGISPDELADLHSHGIRTPVWSGFSGGIFRKLRRLTGVLLRRPSMVRFLKCRSPWHDPDAFIGYFLERALARLNADVVHVHFGTLARQIDMAGYRGNVVVTWHGYDANTVPRFQGEGMYRELFGGNSWRHTVGSDFMRRRLLELGAAAGRLFLVPMGVDLERFSYRERELREGETLQLLSVGRLDEMKGHRYLVQAVSELLKEGVDLSLRIVGSGELENELKAQIQLAGDERIRLLGALDSEQVADEMARAHVFALTGVVASTGRVETQGVVYAEAQASGLPVIGSRVGGVAGSMLDGETGLLCPPEDVNAIKDAIRFFITLPNRIGEFGQRGRAMVEKRFTQDAMLDEFGGLYRSFGDAGSH